MIKTKTKENVRQMEISINDIVDDIVAEQKKIIWLIKMFLIFCRTKDSQAH